MSSPTNDWTCHEQTETGHRRTGDDSDRVKRVKDNSGVAKPVLSTRHTSSTATGHPGASGKGHRTRDERISAPAPAPPRKRLRIRKLAPPRPYPTVPLGRSATGSALDSLQRPSPDEPMCLCVTRKTALPVYIRRCTSAFLQDGAREIRLSAMGAAIPHLALLDELKVEVYTGSEGVVDE
ncbi:hypothetical protein BKA83DRAFT_4170575, partial [Pisolithus microcarpus]